MSNSNDNKYIVDSGVKSPSEGGRRKRQSKGTGLDCICPWQSGTKNTIGGRMHER